MTTANIAPTPIIEARKLEKSYPQTDGSRIQVIAPTDLAVYPGQIITLLGASGCGKSTLLRMLTGLSPASAGAVYWHGHPVRDESPNVAIVFQSFALFPWLTVLETVEAPLEARGMPPIERRKRSLRIIDAVGLDGFETAYPKELSGGMKQRVGVARALVVDRNPAHIHADFAVELPHPRDRKASRFVELVDSIYRILTRPDHKDDVAPPRTYGPGVAVRTKVIMLPHTRPGGLAGLLEILADQGGRVDLHRLADELSLEVDALLPSVDTAALLGFLRLEEGDVMITPEGQAFAQGDIQARKTIFRKAALSNVPLLRQMEQALKAKANRTLNEEFFHDLLDEHFGEVESRRQLETAIQWGRYAEIFDYDAATGKLTLTEA